MKQLKYILMAFAAVLLAVSCSKDELPGEGGDTPVTGQIYTFTVSPDFVMEGEAETRTPTASTDDQPTRCFMQVYDAAAATKVTDPIAGTPSNDDYTFTVELASNTEYTYLFWADNANVEVTDLKAVPYTAGTVAFSYRTTGMPEAVTGSTVSLKHTVTKLTLQTTTETSADVGETVRVTAMCASSYNVAVPANSTFSQQTLVKTFEGPTNVAANKEVASFYFISKDEAQSVDVEFHLLKQTIESVPLAANTHVYLRGDLSEDNPKWGATSKYVEKQIKHFFLKDDGNSKGTPGGNGYYFYLPRSDIYKFDSVIGAILHEEVEISLDGSGKILEKEFEDGYIFLIRNDIYSEILTIYINYTPVYNISYSPYNTDFENFSTVSDVLEQSTK